MKKIGEHHWANIDEDWLTFADRIYITEKIAERRRHNVCRVYGITENQIQALFKVGGLEPFFRLCRTLDTECSDTFTNSWESGKATYNFLMGIVLPAYRKNKLNNKIND